MAQVAETRKGHYSITKQPISHPIRSALAGTIQKPPGEYWAAFFFHLFATFAPLLPKTWLFDSF
jgi:hypothetical protein